MMARLQLLRERFAQRQEGLTVAEMAVSMSIFAVVVLVTGYLLVTGSTVQVSTYSSALSATQAQGVTLGLQNTVQNATAMRIQDSGNRLDLKLATGECVTWKIKNGELFRAKSSTALPTVDGTAFASNVTKSSGGTQPFALTAPKDTPLGQMSAVSYNLALGYADNRTLAESLIYPKVTPASSAPCWS